MATWAERRKFLIGLVIFLFIAVSVSVPAYIVWYHPPTCSDGKMNQSEEGIDCGGECSLICQDRFLPAKVIWTRQDKIAPGVYNIASYIINPNVDVEAFNVPYEITVFDSQGITIQTLSGRVNIPAHKNTLAFIPNVDMGQREPSKVVFQFKEYPVWQKVSVAMSNVLSSPSGGVDISKVLYEQDETGGSLTASIKNTTLKRYDDINIYAILYDTDSNAIGFSKTYIKNLVGNATEDIFFSWPYPRKNTVVTKEIITVIGNVAE